MKNFRILGIGILVLMCMFGFLACPPGDPEDEKPVKVGASVKGQLLILQAFGTGEDGGRAVDRNFVELYNKKTNM